jgi:glycosyltransferase involved in cell wall biosynthesis
MRLGIVVPCYNEQEVIRETVARLLALLDRLASAGKVSSASSIYLVDDGSSDATWRLIEMLATADARVCGIKLSRNRGHQNALLAGLFNAEGDALVSIDADLQDDVNAIEQMVDEHARGADIVYGVRRQRDTDTVFKRTSARMFYRLLKKVGVDCVEDHADFRLLSRRAIDALREFKEVNLFLRGIVPLLGANTAMVTYDRAERFAGESKYPLRKMLALALDGITSFSVFPLRLITFTGFAVFVGSLALSGWVVWTKFFTASALPGWASTLLPLYFLGGVQILCIGVIGEYLGKGYMETKGRPRYFVERLAGQRVRMSDTHSEPEVTRSNVVAWR